MSTLDPRRMYAITGSDIPTICGENPFANRRSVLFKKSLRLRSVDTPATLYGKKYEPEAIRRFCEKTGAKVEISGEDSVYKTHPVYTWIGGTVDGIATFPDGRRMILECKCPFSRPIHADAIPPHYIGQVQTYLFIYDLPQCVFIQYRPESPHRPEILEITYIDRDIKYMALRLPRLKAFYDEMIMWMAYTERVITIIQRAWRFYLARKAMIGAAQKSMVTRLRCAKMVGKMTGFCKTRDAQQFAMTPEPTINAVGFLTYVDSQDVPSPPSKKARVQMQRGKYMIDD